MTDEPGCTCKIGRTADAYGLDDLRSEVGRRYEEGPSLRDLASEVNGRIVDAVLADADADVVGDGESIYRTLSAESADPERQVAIRNQLSDAGVDLEALQSDFVTYQAVRHHLRNCMDVDTSRSGVDTIDEGRRSLAKTRERTRETVTNTLERLSRVDAIEAGDLDVSISLRVRCAECGTSETLDGFLDAGGCDCDA